MQNVTEKILFSGRLTPIFVLGWVGGLTRNFFFRPNAYGKTIGEYTSFIVYSLIV